jgi:predicted unusual protein kinase regulating ubiquinone biosynthesis (AarF/ABC1/UbiB family)
MAIPKVHFEKLLALLASLIANFKFSVPPYFLNNAQALATLEGIAFTLDPDFNILRVIYPYSINQLMHSLFVVTFLISVTRQKPNYLIPIMA